MLLAVEWPLLRASVAHDASEEEEEARWIPTETARRLEVLKARVPAAKAAVGKRAWDAVVNAAPLPTILTSLSGGGRKASRAYYKLREMGLSCALDPPTYSVHLCEAPCGFVQAVAEGFAPTDAWRWLAVSLPTSARTPTPALDVLPMHRGEFLELDVHDEAACRACLPCRVADLVTADGALEPDHEHLEESHFALLVSQTRCMLRCAAPGATFVCKFFEGSHRCTLVWIAFLTRRFRGVGILKPTASRGTNSERYAVCRGLLDTGELLEEDVRACRLEVTWMTETRAVLDRLAEKQAVALEEVLERLGEGLSPNERRQRALHPTTKRERPPTKR